MNGSNIHIRINNYFLVAKHTAAFFSFIFKHSSLFCRYGSDKCWVRHKHHWERVTGLFTRFFLRGPDSCFLRAYVL